ncbi:MAG: rhomboid family intramembrane serine protease [Nanoarchaeota archaeon]
MNNYFYNKKKRNLIGKVKNLSLVAKIIVLNVAIYLLTLILASLNINFIDYLALNPSNIIKGKYLWTLLTHMFTHVLAIHLVINMFALFSLGSLCEKIIGKKRFLWFYIISGVFAGLLSVFLSLLFGNTAIGERIFGSPNIAMIGASGAIFAIAGLYVMLLPRLRFMIIFLPFFTLPAYVMIPLALGVFWIASIIGNLPIGNVAHFGGLLAGLVYGLFLKMKYRNKINKLQKMFR